MNVRLHVDVNTFRPAGSGPASGQIWMILGAESFPAHKWDDFLVIVLEAWLGAVIRIVQGASSSERVHFMEGPFVVEITLPRKDQLHLRAIDRGRKIEQAQANVSTKLFLENLLEVSAEVVAACRRAGDTSADALRLARAREELEKAQSD